MKIELEIGDQRRTFTAKRGPTGVQLTDEDGRVTIVEARRLEASLWEISIGGRRLRIAGAALDGQRRAVWLAGNTYVFRRVPAGGGRASSATADLGSLSATIPSVVREVLVAVGDAVGPGDKLILLESMKMVIPVVAPQAGTVRAILCAPGDSVLPGVPLIEVGSVETSEGRAGHHV